MKICNVDGCEKPIKAHGFCSVHNHRFVRYGDPLIMRRVPADNPDEIRRRFDPKWQLSENGCWIWISSFLKVTKKYHRPVIDLLGKRHKAVRISWLLKHGSMPTGGHLLHTCNNSMCVNPDHLYIGDHAQNMRDVAISGRSGTLKLTADQVLDIFHSKEGSTILAKKYSVERSTVKRIRNGKSRRHITHNISVTH